MRTNADLVLCEGVDQCTTDGADDEAQSEDDHIFGCHCAHAFLITEGARHVEAVRRGIHGADGKSCYQHKTITR